MEKESERGNQLTQVYLVEEEEEEDFA